jgi:protoheme IX farnesyltransferase
VVIGWAAARGELGVEAWSLFSIVFLWQLPHFHALAWLYREDFRRAGLPLMAVVDRDGRRNARHALVYALLLLPASLTPTLIGLAGRFYAGAAFGFGVAFVILASRFAGEQSPTRARSLFVGSLVYLPLVWGLLVADSVF